MLTEFEDAIINLDIDKAMNSSRNLLESSAVKVDAIFKSIGKALDVVGEKYEAGEYFLSELIMAGEVVKEVLGIVASISGGVERETVATVILATVRGDLHDIGKNILSMLLQSSAFKVVDLGIDVAAVDIVKAVKDNDPQIVGLSALLSTTVPEFGNVVNELEKSGLRDKVKLIVGGAAVNEETAKKYRVDAWGRTAVEGLRIAKHLVGIGAM